MRRIILVPLCALSSLISAVPALAGDLDPPSGAVAPTMNRLDILLPSTPITALPITITQPGAYHLAGNLTGSSGLDGIIIDCPTPGTVEIDFRGFTIVSPSDAESTVLIAGTNLSDVTLKNGTLRGGKRMTKADIIAEASRMKIRPLNDRILHMRLEDATDQAVQILQSSVLTIEDTVVTGAGSHAVETHALETHLHNVQITSVGGDGVNVQSTATEHVLLARQVSIIDADGDGVDAAFKPGVKMKDIVCSAIGGDGLIVGEDASIEDAQIDDVTGIGLNVGPRAQTVHLWIKSNGNGVDADDDFHLSDSTVHGSIVTGARATLHGVKNVISVNAVGFAPTSFAGGDHVVRDCRFIIQGTNTANLPACEFLGDDTVIERCHFLMADPPIAGPTLMAHRTVTIKEILKDGRSGKTYDCTFSGIHPNTAALSLAGDDNVVQNCRFSGVAQNASGILIEGATGCLITGNTFTSLGPAGVPVDEAPPVMNFVGPIVTPSTLSSNANPDRNLHVPN